jgi:hypothetical protein
MSSSARSRRWSARVLAAVPALVVAASISTAGAQAVDPIVYDVTPPIQLTTPGSQVGITFTISDLPPCVAGSLVSLDSLDFQLTDPSMLSTIDSFTVSEPPGTVSSNLSPDMKALSLLFDSAFPCLDDGATEAITAVVTLDVPAAVPLGTQLSLEGVARGFASPPDEDYVTERTGLVLVAPDIPPLPPPPPPDPGGNGGDGAGGGGSAGGGAIAAPSGSAVAATAVSATPRFAG